MSEQMSRSNRAIVFMAWGEKYINDVSSCIQDSVLPDYDIFVVTDGETDVAIEGVSIIRANFNFNGLIRKAELFKYLPSGYKSYLFLDSDTKVISDIELGFDKAEIHGIAMSPAPHYSLDWFCGFDKVMTNHGVKLSGQLQYNTGVIFFTMNESTKKVFSLWEKLADKYKDILNNDQPYFTLAMEVCEFNPYTLSIGYNYRGFGDAISGIVRIWHSYDMMPNDINNVKLPWPPRRVTEGKLHYTEIIDGKWHSVPPVWFSDDYHN
jgi:hypothetical protein